MLQLQPEKIEKGIQLIWFALLPLTSLNTLSITNKVIQVKELLSPFLATWEGPSSILSQHNSPDPSQKEHEDQILTFQGHLKLLDSTTFQSHIFLSPHNKQIIPLRV